MPETTQTTVRIAVAQSTVHHDPTNAALLRESGAEVRRLMQQAADADARLVHFTEGAICFPSKRVMSELGPHEIDRPRLAGRGRVRMITLSQRLAEYLAVRRSLGFDLTFEERVLKVFTAFAGLRVAGQPLQRSKHI